MATGIEDRSSLYEALLHATGNWTKGEPIDLNSLLEAHAVEREDQTIAIREFLLVIAKHARLHVLIRRSRHRGGLSLANAVDDPPHEGHLLIDVEEEDLKRVIFVN